MHGAVQDELEEYMDEGSIVEERCTNTLRHWCTRLKDDSEGVSWPKGSMPLLVHPGFRVWRLGALAAQSRQDRRLRSGGTLRHACRHGFVRRNTNTHRDNQPPSQTSLDRVHGWNFF
jgi:hypothetical protein